MSYEDRKIYEIKCHICGTKTGEINYVLGMHRTPFDTDFLDNRCDDCNTSFGTFKELEAHAIQQKIPRNIFEQTLKVARKRTEFVKEVEKIISNNFK